MECQVSIFFRALFKENRKAQLEDLSLVIYEFLEDKPDDIEIFEDDEYRSGVWLKYKRSFSNRLAALAFGKTIEGCVMSFRKDDIRANIDVKTTSHR